MRIPLDRQSAVPLYQQIEDYLRQGILSGSLTPGTRLPASRQLAQGLGVNRLTVENAYTELEVQGLIYSKIGSGTYVLPAPSLPVLPGVGADAVWPLWQQNIKFRASSIRGVTPDERSGAAGSSNPIDFASGIGDARLFPAEDFRKVLQTVMRRDGIEALDYGEPNGHAALRETITHILASQGLQTRGENVLITWEVAGPSARLAALSATLKGVEGVSHVTAFGNTLHVTGEDEAALEKSILAFRQDADLRWRRAQPSLEDVFIHLMAENREAA